MERSRTLPSRVVAMLTAGLLLALTVSPARPFDGKRKGFSLGLHVGPMYLNQHYSAGYHQNASFDSTFGHGMYTPYPSGMHSIAGMTTQFKLGWGFSESVRLSYTTQLDYDGVGVAVGTNYSSDSGIEGGSEGVTLDVYPGGANGRWFGSLGVGAGAAADKPVGGAFHVSAGRDLGRNTQLQLTLSRYGTANDYNVSGRLLFGWLWH